MVLVTATSGFDHGGQRRRGEVFDVSTQHAIALKKKGLVTYDENQVDPAKAAGEMSSASQVAPASPQTTVNESDAGVTDQGNENPLEPEPEPEPEPEAQPAAPRRRKSAAE
ncbi:hypothetical protein [Pseudomonas aeruginosa]|uniref:hypothetical protein n=1 Tax=Pseudomonas aeruginosa TaxID=287 RepID=UPI0019140AEB|nr:hypothetical protein [Pseudomonas aeruginosa]